MRIKGVTLNLGEISMVIQASVKRREENMRNGKDFDHKHGVIADSWGNDLESTGAEVAVAKYLGVYWGAPVNNFKDADIGTNLQVRHSIDHSNNCIIRKRDSSDHFYVLVTGRLPNYKIQGYVLGKDAKKTQYVRAPCNKEPAWFYPQENLKDVDRLLFINYTVIEIGKEEQQKLKKLYQALYDKYKI